MYENFTRESYLAHLAVARCKVKRESNSNGDQAHPGGLDSISFSGTKGMPKEMITLRGIELLDRPPYKIISGPSCNHFKREPNFPKSMFYSKIAKFTCFGPAGSQVILSLAMLVIC
jgi:hypothetical protein